jgi:pilus assembly protein CpaB
VVVRRRSAGSKVLGLLAVASGASAWLLVHGSQARLEALRAAVGRPVPVVVAAHQLARGEVLTPGALRVVELPERYAPPGAVADPRSVSGRVLLAPLAEGEPLTASRIAEPRAGPVAALVDPGLRAVSVAVDVPPGAVRPGDLIDVLATFGGPQPHVETAASAVEVLSVLRPTGPAPGLLPGGPGQDGPTHLVLLVTPETADRLAFARAFADLSVAIRSAEERP